jgi:hypothetical protein
MKIEGFIEDGKVSRGRPRTNTSYTVGYGHKAYLFCPICKTWFRRYTSRILHNNPSKNGMCCSKKCSAINRKLGQTGKLLLEKYRRFKEQAKKLSDDVNKTIKLYELKNIIERFKPRPKMIKGLPLIIVKYCPQCNSILDSVTSKLYECSHCETQFSINQLHLANM